jgi:hypothetical protein
MKKNSIIVPALIAFLLFLTGCQEPVFVKIRSEVTLETATKSGIINSLVRYQSGGTEYLYMENGKIYYKKAADSVYGAWSEDSSAPESVTYQYYQASFTGTQFIKIAADSTYLYALSITYTPDTSDDDDEGTSVPSAKTLYYSTGIGQGWTAITTGLTKDSVVTLFCTNAPQNSHRKAYVRIGDTVYELNGSTAVGSLQTATTNDAGSSTCSAVYFNNDTYFFDAWASSTNETTAADATYMYYASGDVLYYKTASDSSYTSFDLSCTKIISMAINSDSIILGTNGAGLVKVTNTNGVPGSSLDDFSTNADSALGSPYRILMLFSLDPSLTETANSLYASVNFSGTESSSSGSYDDIGLWAYYPVRGNWNRE